MPPPQQSPAQPAPASDRANGEVPEEPTVDARSEGSLAPTPEAVPPSAEQTENAENAENAEEKEENAEKREEKEEDEKEAQPPATPDADAAQDEDADAGEAQTQPDSAHPPSGRRRDRERAGPRVRRAHPRRRGPSHDGSSSALGESGGFDTHDRITDQDLSVHTTRGIPDALDHGLTFTVDTLPMMPGAAMLAGKRSAALVHEAQTGTPVSLRYFIELLGAFVASPAGLQQPFLISMPEGPLKNALADLHGRVLSGAPLHLETLYADYVAASSAARGVEASANHAAMVGEWSRVAIAFRDIGPQARERILDGNDTTLRRFFARLAAPIDSPDRPGLRVARQFLRLLHANIRNIPRSGAVLGAYVGRLAHDAMTAATAEEMGLRAAPERGDGTEGSNGDVPSTFNDLLGYLMNAEKEARTAIIAQIERSGLFALAAALRDAMTAGPDTPAPSGEDLRRLDSLTLLLAAILNTEG